MLNLKTKKRTLGWKSIHHYIREKDLKNLKKLIDNGADINEFEIPGTGHTPLLIAIIYSTPAIADFLIEAGSDPNKTSRDRTSPLTAASTYGYIDLVKKLLQAGADINAQQFGTGSNSIDYNLKCGTALMNAACYGHQAIVSELLQAGAKINIKDHRNKTALDYAKHNDHGEITQMLHNAELAQKSEKAKAVRNVFNTFRNSVQSMKPQRGNKPNTCQL